MHVHLQITYAHRKISAGEKKEKKKNKKKIRLQLGLKQFHPLAEDIKCKNRQMDTYVNVAAFVSLELAS